MCSMKFRPPLQTKTKRLPKGKTVTICAGFKSQFGVVLCADSQETIGAMKFDAPKLVIRPEIGFASDKVRMVFAGAGDGPFIDKLVNEMWKAAIAGPVTEFDKILERIEDKNLQVHEKIWRVYPKDDRPQAHILFAILAAEESPRLFKAAGPVINEVENYAFVGIGLELGTFLAENFRPDSVEVEQDVSAALFILENAKRYVDSCGGDTQLAALMIDGSILTLERWKADELSKGFSDISLALYYLFGHAINLEYPSNRFDDSASEVLKSIRKAREELRQRVPERIKVSEELKNSYLPLFAKIEWPATRRVHFARPSDSQTSEDQS